MLVVRTCQLYPTASAATLVHKFFLVFSKWEWPNPVLLKLPENVSLNYSVWDPRVNIFDRKHLMPIITPAYPQQNSTFNVNCSTLAVMQEEIRLGFTVTEEIMAGKTSWDKLFEPQNFFSKYKHFIALIASSCTAEQQLEWVGLVESQIRKLIVVLENNEHIALAHINPLKFDPIQSQLPSTINTMWFIGLQFRKTESLKLDLVDDFNRFVDLVHHQAGIENGDQRLIATHVKRKDLNLYLPPNVLPPNTRSGSKREMKTISSLPNESLRNLSSTQPRKRPLDLELE